MINPASEEIFRLYLTDVSSLSEKELFSGVYNRVNKGRKEITDKYIFEKDKYLSLGVEYLLITAASDFGLNYQSEEIIRKKGEKPFFKSASAEFNLSHSGTKAICVFSGHVCGCDVEKINAAEDPFIRRFFHEKEAEYLLSFPEGEKRNTEFTRLWTLKESYVKCLGVGFGLSPTKYCIIPENGKIVLTHTDEDSMFSFYEYDKKDGYKYAVCIKKSPLNSDIAGTVCEKEIIL